MLIAEEVMKLKHDEHSKYKYWNGKLLQMMRQSKSNSMDTFREASCHMMKSDKTYMKALLSIIR